MEDSFTLRQLRERQEWTQEQLAEIAEIDVEFIQQIEAGTPVNWTIATRIMVKVKNYLGNQAVEGLSIPQKKD
ncbi:MAG TPA: helix-turn-helix transcriptional regulator [Ktedonobacteraceae bacterium]|nr:helix-turn-helix transcriptional regulator [Ktedonobacteraceae bacterium]